MTGDSPDLRMTGALRAEAGAHGWSVEQTVDAIVERFGMSRLKAHRLARGWTRPRAVEEVLATYDADGLARTGLTTSRLCNWEHGKDRPGEEYRDRLCRVYATRPDLLGFAQDYTAEPGPAAEPAADYAGHHDGQADEQEARTHRRKLFQAAGAAGVGVALEHSGLASMRLSQMVEETNVGPFTLEHLERRVTGILADIHYAPCHQMLRRTSALRDEVAALLEGKQTLAQRAVLYRIAGQLSRLLGWIADDLGNYPVAYAHLLTAEQLAREVGDHTLLASVRVGQSTVALWDGDFAMALEYAREGQRYATSGTQQAALVARCEARALARMGDRSGTYQALQRAEPALPSYHQSGDDPDGAWSLFSAGDVELYTAIALLWLGQPRDTELHARQAIRYYETTPPPFESPANLAQSQITLAICIVHQGHPEEGIRLATEALTHPRTTEHNLRQAEEVLTALSLRHRDLPATRAFADHLHTLRTP